MKSDYYFPSPNIVETKSGLPPKDGSPSEDSPNEVDVPVLNRCDVEDDEVQNGVSELESLCTTGAGDDENEGKNVLVERHN